MRALITAAVDGIVPSVVLVAYPRATIEVEGALTQFLKEKIEGGESQSDLESALRNVVTVVTIGSATAGFPEGPAYVHIAAWTDALASTSGVTERNNKVVARTLCSSTVVLRITRMRLTIITLVQLPDSSRPLSWQRITRPVFVTFGKLHKRVIS